MKVRSVFWRTSRSAKSASDWEMLLDHIKGYAICVLDRRGCVQTWNESAVTLTGYARGEAVGKPYALFFTKSDIQDGVPQKILSYAAEKGQYHGENILQMKDGKQYWADITVNAIRDNKKRLLGFAKIAHNASHARDVARQRDEFIGIAAHELKTPITTLNLYAELLREKLKSRQDKANLELMRDIENQIDRLVHLVDDLLTVNALEAGSLIIHKREYKIDDLVEEVIRTLQNMTKHHTITFIGTLNKGVRIDQGRIRQVLINLLENAIKYSHKGKIVVRVRPQKNKALISVQDQGPGISKVDQQNIFHPRYRSRDKRKLRPAGLGLGLYICSEIMKAHGEKIWVESAPQKGSTFFFTLPFAR